MKNMLNETDENFTMFQPEELYHPPECEVREARILLLMPRLIFLIVVMFVGSIGNLLVLYVYHFKSKSSTFTLFVQVLSVYDLINCFTSMPAAIALVILQDVINVDSICAVTPFLSLYTAIASGILFLIIAVQRYQGICKPLMKSFDLPRAKIMCIFSAVIALLPSLLRLFLDYGRRSEVEFNDTTFNITMCVGSDESKDKPLYIIYSIILAIIFFGIFGTLTVLYILMWYTMFKNAKNRSELFQNQPANAANGGKHNSFKIFFAITVVFVLSYLPHLVVLTFKELDQNLTLVRRAFYDLAYYSPLWNNAANPLVYSFFSKEFRYKCKKLLSCSSKIEKKFSVSSIRDENNIRRASRSSC